MIDKRLIICAEHENTWSGRSHTVVTNFHFRKKFLHGKPTATVAPCKQ